MAKIAAHTKLERLLTKLGAQLGSAETHGLLTGMLSITSNEGQWGPILIENLDCVEPTKTQWNTISAVATEIRTSFAGLKFSFALLLPDESMALGERIDALGYWCRGYLSGLALVGLTAEDLKNDIVKELVHDLSQIAHISRVTDSSDEDEHNFVELVEFVRIAVQNIQLELQSADQKQMLH